MNQSGQLLAGWKAAVGSRARSSSHSHMSRAGVFLLLAASLAAAPGLHAAATNEAARARLEAMQNGVRETTSIHTDFVQHRRLSLLQQEVIITGRVVADQSGRLAWRVLSPLRYMLVLDGTNLQQWDEATDKVQSISLKGNPVFDVVARQMRGWFRGDFAPLLKDFDIEAPADRPRTLVFVPRPDSFVAKAVRRVAMTSREDFRYMQEMEIEELSGDRTVMIFSNTVLNAAIAPGEWKVGPEPSR